MCLSSSLKHNFNNTYTANRFRFYFSSFFPFIQMSNLCLCFGFIGLTFIISSEIPSKFFSWNSSKKLSTIIRPPPPPRFYSLFSMCQYYIIHNDLFHFFLLRSFECNEWKCIGFGGEISFLAEQISQCQCVQVLVGVLYVKFFELDNFITS